MRAIIEFLIKLYYRRRPKLRTWTVDIDETRSINLITLSHLPDRPQYKVKKVKF